MNDVTGTPPPDPRKAGSVTRLEIKCNRCRQMKEVPAGYKDPQGYCPECRKFVSWEELEKVKQANAKFLSDLLDCLQNDQKVQEAIRKIVGT